MLGLRDSIADVIVLAECGRFPLQSLLAADFALTQPRKQDV